jgi:hypothetical protein
MMRFLNSLFRPKVSRKVHNLIWSVRHEDRQPYAVFRARAEVNRFLNDPKEFRREVGDLGGHGLQAPHVQLGMEAQSLAFNGHAEAAADKMREALRALPLPGSLKDAAARNAAEIHRLGRTFIDEQLIRSGNAEQVSQTGRPQDGAAPPVPFIDYMRAVHLAHRQKFDEAFRMVSEFDKLFPRHTPFDHADYATRLAALCVDFDALIPQGERIGLRMRLLEKSLAAFEKVGAVQELSRDWRTGLLYWKGIVLSQQARTDPDATRAEAMALFEQADALLREASTHGTEPPWSTAIEGARQKLLNEVARVGIDEGRTELADLRLLGFRNLPDSTLPEAPLGWQWLWDTWTTNQSPEAVELVERGRAKLSEQFEFMPRQTDGRRIVLEVSESMLVGSSTHEGDTVLPEPMDLLGRRRDDAAPSPDMPSLSTLRDHMEARYGLALPGILVTYYATPEGFNPETGTGALLVDGIPLAETISLPASAQHFEVEKTAAPAATSRRVTRRSETDQRSGAQEDVNVFEQTLVPATRDESVAVSRGRADAPALLNREHFAAHWVGQVIFKAYDAFIDSWQVERLELSDLDPRLVYPMLRLLIADRTPLHDLEGLKTCAEQGERQCNHGHDGEMAMAAVASAKAYRELPAVRSMLWGVVGEWTDVRLDVTRVNIETHLKAHLEQNGPFVALPSEMRRHIKRILEPDKPAAVPGSFDQVAGAASVNPRGALSAECRVVVREPDVRGCLRAAFPTLANPIITELEREAGHALNRRNLQARGTPDER